MLYFLFLIALDIIAIVNWLTNIPSKTFMCNFFDDFCFLFFFLP